ncbi:MAG TPA: hypothetical protein VGW31_08910, partial [Hanamia sp.]|nr:hypothetical protein [Hanamia sp.]
MSIQFQSLFTIQVLHDYYNRHSIKCNDFDIVPTEDCALLMKNRQVLYKNYNNKLLTVVNASKEVNNTPPPDFRLTPFIDLGKEVVFRWYLILKNPHFGNFTSIAAKTSEKKRFYFSNLTKNKVGDTLSLSNLILPHTVSRIYGPGNLVKGPDDNFYEAVRISDGTAESKDIANKNYWQKTVANNPYTSENDEVILAGSNFHYKLQTPATHINIKIFSLNKTDTNLPYDNLIETVEKTFTQNQESVSIDVNKRSPGKYRVVVNGEEDSWVYVDNKALSQNVFG